MKEREHWKNRSTFIMAAVGSAIGLGNLWRFPYIAAQNGGGAFLIPYFIALLTAGIPLMIVEYSLGVRSQSSANIALGVIRKKFRYIGWISILSAFVINVYYCAVMGWTWGHLLEVFTIKTWGADLASSQNHFFNNFLGVDKAGGNPFNFAGINYKILAGLLLTWLSIWAIVKGGLNQVGKVLLYTVPLPVILVLILVVRGLTLHGATTGLNYFLTPDWSKLLDPQVWLAAYGQIFYSLSVGFGVMIAYASFMPRDTEIPNSAAIASFSNCAFSFLAGFAVFSVLGYFAVATNSDMSTVAKGGPGLAFVVYPAALAKLPVGVTLFAMLFFLTLLLLGIDSAFSLLEAVSAAISDKFDYSRTKSTTIVALISVVMGIPFVTRAGLLWLDIVDHFLMSYVITLVGILESIAVGYFLGIHKFESEVNKNAEIKLGVTFSVMIKIVTPLVLLTTFVLSLIKEVKTPYEGYSSASLISIGGGTILFVFLASFFLGHVRTKNDSDWEKIESEVIKQSGGEAE